MPPPHLFADIPSLLRPELLQPVGPDLVEVALDSGLERLVLPDGCRAEAAACELTRGQPLSDDDVTDDITSEGQQLTPTVKTSGRTSRPKARWDLSGARCSTWGAGVRRWGATSEASAWGGASSSSAFLDSGFLETFLKPHLCWMP